MPPRRRDARRRWPRSPDSWAATRRRSSWYPAGWGRSWSDRVAASAVGGGVLRLVEAELGTTGQGQGRDRSPPLLVYRAGPHTLVVQRRDGRVEVVAHQVQLVPELAVGRVRRQFGGWQREDQPT